MMSWKELALGESFVVDMFDGVTEDSPFFEKVIRDLDGRSGLFDSAIFVARTVDGWVHSLQDDGESNAFQLDAVNISSDGTVTATLQDGEVIFIDKVEEFYLIGTTRGSLSGVRAGAYSVIPDQSLAAVVFSWLNGSFQCSGSRVIIDSVPVGVFDVDNSWALDDSGYGDSVLVRYCS